MSDTKTEGFRTILENARTELTNGSRSRASLAVEATPDELDRIQEAGDREYTVWNLERDTNRLREVREALRRLDSDSFGICSSCEGHIVLKRLTAVPWAALCIGCQEDADQYAAASGRDGRLQETAA